MTVARRLLGLVGMLVRGSWNILFSRESREASRFYDRSGRPKDDGSRLTLEPVSDLRLLPLVDFYAARPGLATENGVSYLVTAGNTTVLFDLGFNRSGSPEPPLLQNMAVLGVLPASVDCIVLSHPHGDHVGGGRNAGTQTLQGLPFAGKPVYATAPFTMDGQPCHLVTGPAVLAPGIGTTGALPVQLMMGHTAEQALVVHVAGKGLVVIIGCGHPGVIALTERAEQVFGLPVYGVIGGLHLPITDDRAKVGFIKPQRLLGTAHPFTRPLREKDARKATAYLREKGVGFVSLSAHDSCDWTLQTFARELGPVCHPLLVGQELRP